MKYSKICKRCKNEFKTGDRRKVFCTGDCYLSFSNRNVHLGPQVTDSKTWRWFWEYKILNMMRKHYNEGVNWKKKARGQLKPLGEEEMALYDYYDFMHINQRFVSKYAKELTLQFIPEESLHNYTPLEEKAKMGQH